METKPQTTQKEIDELKNELNDIKRQNFEEEFLNSDNFDQIDWGDGKTRNRKNFDVYGVIISSWEENVEKHELHGYLLHDATLFILQGEFK